MSQTNKEVTGTERVAPEADNLLVRTAPIIFVFMWATGYPASKFGTADADPFTLLAVRFAIATLLLAIYVFAIQRPKEWDLRQVGHSVIIGVLMQGIYLGGVFYAVSTGLPAGLASLVVALQPFMTAIAAIFVLGERLSLTRFVFFLFALFGVFIVLFPNLGSGGAVPGVTMLTVIAIIASPLSISLGAVYQKRCVPSINLWVGTMAQFAGATVAMVVMSALFEDQRFELTSNTVLSLAWLILVLSIGAVGLLMYLIRRGNSASVASLFYLVPVVTLFMTWILFNETLNLTQAFGSLLVVVCVALSNRYK